MNNLTWFMFLDNHFNLIVVCLTIMVCSWKSRGLR